MKFEQISPLVIFPENTFKEIEVINEFLIWVRLQKILRNKDFEAESLEVVLSHYDSILNKDGFLDIQLKFYLLRISQKPNTKPKDLGKVIQYWVSIVETKFPMNLRLKSLSLQAFSNSFLKQFGKYFISLEEYFEYMQSWNSSTVDIHTWKKFHYLEIPKDFYFLKPMLEKEETVNFPNECMRKLFYEYVDETYDKKFKPRLTSEIFVETDKLSIERVLRNTGTNDDKKHLNRLITGFYHWETLSKNLFECLEREATIHPSNMDINSSANYAGYLALIRYYEKLKGKTGKQKLPVKAMWFKNSKINSNEELKIALQDIFDMINTYCPSTSWSDFKSIFNKKGASTKIEWTGDAELLNYIFRKLNPVLKFSGGKWNVIDHYFYRGDENDRSLDADKLQGSSHYDESKNEKLSARLDEINLILKR